MVSLVVAGVGDDPSTVDLDDAALLARHEPIIRFNEGEYFLPASVDAFVERAELWERTGPGSRRRVAAVGELDLCRLVSLTDGPRATHHLRLVSARPTRAEFYGWQLRRDRPRFRAETRLGRVGVLTRLVDAASRVSLLARGRTPRRAQAGAAMLDRDRPDHGDHPYYGRVVRDGGYTVLQYWFFSFFNDWRSRAHGVNDHEGDWEQVTIYLVDDGVEGLRPAWVAFSAHDEVGPDLRRRWDDPDLTVIDGHPVVHAGLGSHAGAVLAGEYLVTVRTSRYRWLTAAVRRVSRFLQPWTDRDEVVGVGIPYVEYARGDGVSIGPTGDRPWRQVVIDDDTPWVRWYTGLWGDDTNDPFGGERGPAGPRYERNGTVRQSWGDPVGWAALDAVVPDDAARAVVVAARLDELAIKIERIAAEREQRRDRLRANEIAGVANNHDDERTIVELGAELVVHTDELQRLSRHGRGDEPPHPHAHLRHRAVPLPVESKERRRLLTAWATISTPLLFVLAALAIVVPGASLVVFAAVGALAVFAIEALTRGQLLTYALRALGAVVAIFVTLALGRALLESWRITVATVLLTVALVFLVLNFREVRRT